MESNISLGIIGLGVMGSSLALNFASNSNKRISVFNRSPDKTKDLLHKITSDNKLKQNILPSFKLEEFLLNLHDTNTKVIAIILMITAGKNTERLIDNILEIISKSNYKGDSKELLIIDCANEHYSITESRYIKYNNTEIKSTSISYKLKYVGVGVSGGEVGARYGPSLMVGCDFEEYNMYVETLFTPIAATVNNKEVCLGWTGPRSAGHYVKMVHNGIEYAEMGIISETYEILKQMLSNSNIKNETKENANEIIAKLFTEINNNSNYKLNSYLLEITSNILSFKESDTSYLIDNILDKTGSKGTGKWTVQIAADLGVPIPSIDSALSSRYLSSFKDLRTMLNRKIDIASDVSGFFKDNKFDFDYTSQLFCNVLYFCKLMIYSQGFHLLSTASQSLYDSKMNSLDNICKLWRNGCIIRSSFLELLIDTYKTHDGLLIGNESVIKSVYTTIDSVRNLVSLVAKIGISSPIITSCLLYFDAFRREYLNSAALLSAQRDYFGAHEYEKVDKYKQGKHEKFHTEWEKYYPSKN